MARSLRASLLSLGLRLFFRPLLGRSRNVPRMRWAFERMTPRMAILPKGVRDKRMIFSDGEDAVPGLMLTPPRAEAGLIVYFHGGGYLVGTPETHQGLAGRIAVESRLAVFLPDLPLAPEHPHPAPYDHAMRVWRALRTAGYQSDQIVIGGDSAGGGMALALLAGIAPEAPAALFAFSPFTDASFSGASFAENAKRDPVLPADQAEMLIDHVLKGQDPNDPRISPLFASFSAPCPIWLTASNSEILRDDTTRMAARLQAASYDVTAEMRDGLPHVWPFFPRLPESVETIGNLGVFLRKLRIGRPTTSAVAGAVVAESTEA